MNRKIIFCLPGNESLTAKLAKELSIETGIIHIKQFPDKETYIRIESEVKGAEAVLVCTLNEPDNKLLPLYFLCKTLYELGAEKITLVSPYLAYMRQNKRFFPGEAVTTRLFAGMISDMVDELITVDPHLNDSLDLSSFYNIPVKVLHAAPLIVQWIKENIKKPLLVAHNDESRKWIGEIASSVSAPYITLSQKTEDEDVNMASELKKWEGYKPVIVDDIIVTARTMIIAVRKLKSAGGELPVCIGVHGIFAGMAELQLFSTDAEIITTNAVPHHTNRIDITPLLTPLL
ncbi:MAG: ribose-phosphate diphosphokinase, partial [Bacteroidota bacterium]